MSDNKVTVLDSQTGEIVERDMTPEEIAAKPDQSEALTE